MIFKRTPSQVGRNVELCHPPKYLEKVKPGKYTDIAEENLSK